MTRNPEFYNRQLIFRHYNSGVRLKFHSRILLLPTHSQELTYRIAHILTAVALRVPIIKKNKSKYVTILTESLRSVDFLHGSNILPTAQPGWYALVANLNSSTAPSGLIHERFGVELASRGLADVDILNSLRPFYAEPLYLRP